MASSSSSDDSLFEKTHISSTVSADDATSFFLEHGIFYRADADIGKLVAKLGSKALHQNGIYDFMPALSKYPVSMTGDGPHSITNAL
jgi:hypothetical protein